MKGKSTSIGYETLVTTRANENPESNIRTTRSSGKTVENNKNNTKVGPPSRKPYVEVPSRAKTVRIAEPEPIEEPEARLSEPEVEIAPSLDSPRIARPTVTIEEEEEEEDLAYLKVPPLQSTPIEDLKKRKLAFPGRAAQAQPEKPKPTTRNKAPVQRAGQIDDIIDLMMKSTITVRAEDLLGVSNEVREAFRKRIQKQRHANTVDGALYLEEPDLPFSEDEEGDQNDIDLDDIAVLEPVRVGVVKESFMSRFVDGPALPQGALIANDPVLQYLNDTALRGETPKPVVVAKESQGLRAVYPLINGTGTEEAIVDGGSQIVSMSENAAVKLGISWTPDVIIHMQSANAQVEPTLGLARNVPFLFADMTLYLQVHIVREPAYSVLLGRPFDTLTESIVHNTSDGGQTITITDPNTRRRITMPTFPRGAQRVIDKGRTKQGFQASRN